MKLIRCDNHPDKNAVVTLVVRILPAGSRPWWVGAETPRQFVDLCVECREKIVGDILQRRNDDSE